MQTLLARTAFLFHALCTAAMPAGAGMIATDNFDSYGTGAVVSSANGGTGWSGGWTVASGATVVATVAGAGPTGDAPMAGQALRFTANQNSAAVRTLATTQSGNLWIEYLFQAHTGTVNNSDFLALWFDSPTNQANSRRALPPGIRSSQF